MTKGPDILKSYCDGLLNHMTKESCGATSGSSLVGKVYKLYRVKTIRIVVPMVKGRHGNLTRYSSILKTLWVELEKWWAVESPDLCCPRCRPCDKLSGYDAEGLSIWCRGHVTVDGIWITITIIAFFHTLHFG